MKKIYLLIIAFGFLLCYNNTTWAQCSVSISTNPNTTQLDCNNTSITLSAKSGASGPITYLWNTGEKTASIKVKNSGTYSVTIKDTGTCITSSSIIITKNITTPTVGILPFPGAICAGSSSTLVGTGANTYQWQPGSLNGTAVSVAPVVTTTYTVTGTAANGCTGTNTLKLVVNPLPGASISADATGCQYGDEPGVTFKGTNGNAPYTFTYNTDGGPTQTVTTNPDDSLITIGVPTGQAGLFTYNLISVTDSNGCTHAQSGKVVVKVFPAPLFTSSKTESICNNDVFSYTATSSVTGTNFKWTRAVVQGISNAKGSGSTATINETLNNTTTQPVVANYVFTLSTGIGCDKTDTVKVTVNPTPAINPISDDAFCNGYFVTNGIAFSSSSPDSSFTWTCNPTIGFGTSGSGSIPAFNATNNDTVPIVATVKVSITASTDNCTSTGSSVFKITVYPGPVLTSSKIASVCNNAPFIYTATSSAAGTSFKWNRAVVTGISNSSANGSTALINETLHNTTSQPVVVNYIFNLSIGTGCDKTDTVKVTVNPTPKINTINDTAFCNGDAVPGITFSSTSPNPSFTWISDTTIGFGSSGSGNIPAFNATNNDSVPIVATVKVSITASSDKCPGSDTSFKIAVRPSPALTSPAIASVCDNALFTYTAKSSSPGTTFSWTRATVPGIANPAASGSTATINETLHNTTSDTVVVNYIFTLTPGRNSASCSKTATVKVVVNPTPVINSISDYTYCNGDTVSGIKFTSVSPNSSFTWTCIPTIGFGSSGSDSIPVFTATNNDTVSIVATVRVSITASSDKCPGSDTSFKITVRPSPLLTSPAIASVCDNALFTYNAKSSSPGTTFSWTRATVPGIANPAAGGSTATINETLHNTTSDTVVVNYIFTLTPDRNSASCSKTATVKVVVNPTPVIKAINDSIFCNGYSAGGFKFSSTSPNSSFTWVSAATIGFGLSGSGSIPAFTATNADSIPIIDTVKVSITASSDKCAGSDSSFTITVYPTPVLTSPIVASVCDSTPFIYTAKSYAKGTNFKWRRDSVAGIANKPASDTTAFINETLHNTTTQPVVVNYVFDLSTGLACNKTDSVKVTVNPTPVIDQIPDYTFCNGDAVVGIAFSSTSPDASFTWVSDRTVGFGTSGSNSIPVFTATNNDSVPIVATVKVSITASSDKCAGSNSAFTIKVYPTPILTSPAITSVCNNAPFIYTAKSSAQGTSFEWTRDVVAGISNEKNSGSTATINEALHNTTTQPVVVKYVFTLSTGFRCNKIDSVKVTVNPTPAINTINDTAFCNGDAVRGIRFSSASPNPSFTWVSDTTVGFGSGGSDSIPAFIATNTDTVLVVATVKVSITASSDHCAGSDSSFTITVKPSPLKPGFTSFSSYPDNEILVLCDSSENINFNLNSPATPGSGVSYNWTSMPDSPKVLIKDRHHANTVVSFNNPGIDTIKVVASSGLTGCKNSASQLVQITNNNNGIDKLKIFKKQPGNLLIYPDNAIKAYQWGYDSLIQASPDTAFGPPIIIQGQVYQTFIPDTRFTVNDSLDENKYFYWVLLNNNSCNTKVYYNGPYDDKQDSVRRSTQDATLNLLVIPNPNKGIFEIGLKGNIYGNIDAKIYNALGQLVFRKTFIKTVPEVIEKFNANNLPGGIYFLVLNSSDLKQVSTRFLISR